MPPAFLDRTLLRVSGPDAASLLQGVLTQNLDTLAHARTLYAGLLSAQGKVIADMFLWADGEHIIIDADPARGDDLLRRLSMFKLRAKAAIEPAADLGVLIADAPFANALPDPRLPALGFRALAPRNTSAPHADAAAYDAHRIKLGVPDLARDCEPEEVFALEALFEELHGVDFHKGCFVGQENASRMKRRATTRKKFCRLAFDGAPPAPGTPLRVNKVEFGAVRASTNGAALGLMRVDRVLVALGLGHTLTAGDTPMRLNPPDWLILPEAEPPAPA